MKGRETAYAYQCVACGHLVTQHLMASDAPSLRGPYACTECDCQIDQFADVRGLTRAEFDAAYPDWPMA